MATRWGLLLGGGGVPGVAAHLGLINRLMERGKSPDAIVGVSAGGLVTATLAVARNQREWRDLCKNWNELAKLSGIIELIPSEVREALVTGLGEQTRTPGLLDLKIVIERVLSGVYTAKRTAPVGEWQQLVAVVASDITEGQGVLIGAGTGDKFESMTTEDAMCATAAFPFVFQGVRDGEGHLLMDGGIFWPQPISALRDVFKVNVVVAATIHDVSEHYASPVDGIRSLDDLFWALARYERRNQHQTQDNNLDLEVKLPTYGGLLSMCDWSVDYAVGRKAADYIVEELSDLMGTEGR